MVNAVEARHILDAGDGVDIAIMSENTIVLHVASEGLKELENTPGRERRSIG